LDTDEIDYDNATAAAKILGTIGAEAKAAIPTLIEVLQADDEDGETGELRREAALALSRMGPDAKAAVPVLRKLLEESSHEASAGLPAQASDAAVVALFHLAPDGKRLADEWVGKSVSPVRRAFVLGAMGVRSLEGELLARRRLADLEAALGQGRHEEDETLFVEGYFERLSDLGVGAELAIPRLNELSTHRNPWLRQWARESLMRIMPTAKPSTKSTPKVG
jgi:hypothetical protein